MITIEIKKLGEGGFSDRTTSILWDTIKIRQALTKEVDSCLFSVRKYGGLAYKPEEEDEIIVKQDGVKIFAGFIVRVEETVGLDMVLNYDCECRDHTHLLDRKLVAKTYTGQTILQIITDIKNNFSASGITVMNVQGTELVDVIIFNNENPSACLQKLADIYNKDWYIDYDKDIHFFSKETNVAPFSLSDNGDKYIFDTLKLTRDTTQIKNSVFVEGGEELSDTSFTEKFIADGTQHTFSLAYKYAQYSLIVAGVGKTVGLDGIDDFTTKDALYNFQNFTLRFNPASPPLSGQLIEWTGKYYFEIKTLVREIDSVTKYGEKQFQIVDNSIKDRDVARERAKAELFAYASRMSEGEFDSYEAGLRAGQRIIIQSDVRGFAEDFLINNLEGEMYTPQKIKWRASIVSVKTFDVIDLLAKIVEKSDKQIDADQVVRTADLVLRKVKVSRNITVFVPLEIDRILNITRFVLSQLGFTPTWVAGTYVPVNLATDPKRNCYADRSCIVAN